MKKIRAIHRRDALARTLRSERRKFGRKPARELHKFFAERINHHR